MKFAIFICSHGRPEVLTVKALRDSGYSGDIYILIDDEDDKANEYNIRYGNGNTYNCRLIKFCKQDIIDITDTGCRKGHEKRGVILYAKQACEIFAKKFGLAAFGIADDDFKGFRYRYSEDGKMHSLTVSSHLDDVFREYSRFIIDHNMCMTSLATDQMFMGGEPNICNYRIPFSFTIRNVSIPFEWKSDLFEDIVSETLVSQVGYFMMQMPFVQLNLLPLYGGADGGMTEAYQSENFVGKLFPVIKYLPSMTKIIMGRKRPTIKLEKDKAFPKLISSSFKKKEYVI